MRLATELRDPAALRARSAQCAAGLRPHDPLELYLAIKKPTHRGSRAWPSDDVYRSAAPTHDALVDTCPEALRIESRT